uniref:NAC domain-containing protein n=1 Tax=Kalanchoe fedtschenkoi TaxID=63787 RepID=A0A7N0U437_KALFE
MPFGFRFNPTDEEVVIHYLAPKAINCEFSVSFIGEADFNKCEPWDLPKIENMDNSERFYYCQRDRKYPNGLRTNRATKAGFWKATGKDREIYRGKIPRRELIGMRKTLVFYTGRAPRGEKTNWVMYEYRLMPQFFTSSMITPQNEEWVLARVFYKNDNLGGGATTMHSKPYNDHESTSGSLWIKADQQRLVIREDFESLPPLVDHSTFLLPLPPPPTVVKPLMCPPAPAIDPRQDVDDLLIYADNPVHFYPAYSATLLPPEIFGCEQPKKDHKIDESNNVAIGDAVEINKCQPEPPDYPVETSSNANQAFDDIDDEFDLPDLGSLPDLSILWD